MDRELTFIDLFCGAGGLTAGFVLLSGKPYRPLFAVDFDPKAAETYARNFGGHCAVGDLVALLEREPGRIPRADVVIGGPPCQGFSLLNRRRAGDLRKSLWRPYMEVVARSGASCFVMENVPQLLDTEEHRAILRSAEALGFSLWSGKLRAVDYGVPQGRVRAFIVGAKGRDPGAFFPPPKPDLPPATVRSAVGDLPPPVGTAIRDLPPPLDLHFGRSPTEKSLARYRAIPEEGMNRFDLLRAAPELTPECWKRKERGGTDLFGRLWWDRPSATIRTEFFKPEKGRYLHPEQHRPLTHREAARLQTFPDSFRFCGSKNEIARQIGNAVPPLLAAAVAKALYALAVG